jgi:hypothetical protein
VDRISSCGLIGGIRMGCTLLKKYGFRIVYDVGSRLGEKMSSVLKNKASCMLATSKIRGLGLHLEFIA